MPTAVMNNKSLADEVATAHSFATEQMLAASDASHPLRQSARAESLLRDARMSFQNMGQTLLPELLRELEEARRLLALRPSQAAHGLSQQDVDDLRNIRALARDNGWSVSLGKRVDVFMRSLVDGLAELADKSGTKHATRMLKEWWSENPDLRYAELSRGRVQEVMVTLWQINAEGDDIKLGHGQGETLEEAVQRARGTILL